MKQRNHSKKTNTFQKTILVLFGILIFLMLFETILFLTDLDLKMMKNQLYYQTQDIEVYKESENINRIYELKPNSSSTYNTWMHDLEKKYTNRTVTINSLGFRDIEREKIKPTGVYRIIIFGGSNTYGASVDDKDTYPRILEEKLNNEYPGKFEVWNAGVCAYVPSQKVEYAKEIIKDYYPDMLIFQDFNKGRRAFLVDQNYITFLKKNKELISENIPLFFIKSKIIKKIHYFLIQNSRTYRFILVNINDNIIRSKDQEYLKEVYVEFGKKINWREYDNFFSKNKNPEIVLFNFYEESWCQEKELNHSNMKCFLLPFETKPKEYSDTHPPSYVYEWYGEELKNYLIKNYFSNISD